MSPRRLLSRHVAEAQVAASPRLLARALAARAGQRAFAAFCTPRLSTARPADHDRLAERARFHLRDTPRQRIATSVGAVQAYVVEPESEPRASVLVVHGWTGEAAFMSAFADFVRRRGMRAVLLDLPAHGESDGERTSLVACAHAVREVADALGPVRFAIGHSIGAMAVMMACEGRAPMPRALSLDAAVLVAMPDRFADVTRAFAIEHGLSRAGRAELEARLERLAGRRVAEFSGAGLLAATGLDALIVHSRDDAQVAYADAERMAGAAARAELLAVDGLGHRAILYAPPVVRAATAFLQARLGD